MSCSLTDNPSTFPGIACEQRAGICIHNSLPHWRLVFLPFHFSPTPLSRACKITRLAVIQSPSVGSFTLTPHHPFIAHWVVPTDPCYMALNLFSVVIGVELAECHRWRKCQSKLHDCMYCSKLWEYASLENGNIISSGALREVVPHFPASWHNYQLSRVISASNPQYSKVCRKPHTCRVNVEYFEMAVRRT